MQVKQGTSITVTAVPDSGYKFAYWSGDFTGTVNPATITVQKDMSIVAVFLPST